MVHFLKFITTMAIGLTAFGSVVTIPLQGDSFRYKNKVIHTGMSKGKVFLITGQPDWKTAYLLGDGGQVGQLGFPLGSFSTSKRMDAYGGEWEPSLTVAVEEWLFNRGKYRLMQLLRFEDERLVAIEGLGYGFSEDSRRTPQVNDWTRLQVGDTSYELLQKVGEPALTETKPSIRVIRLFGPNHHTLHYRSADVEWWYFNAGENRLFRIVKLVNGRVIEIQTEGFGVSQN